jgi:hypothetical protein
LPSGIAHPLGLVTAVVFPVGFIIAQQLLVVITQQLLVLITQQLLVVTTVPVFLVIAVVFPVGFIIVQQLLVVITQAFCTVGLATAVSHQEFPSHPVSCVGLATAKLQILVAPAIAQRIVSTAIFVGIGISQLATA